MIIGQSMRFDLKDSTSNPEGKVIARKIVAS